MLRRIASYMKGYGKDAAAAPLYVAVETVCQLLIPLLMAYIIDEGIEMANMAAVYKYGALMMLVALIATFTGNVNNFNVIYLLSGGDPVTDLASTAGSTDLLVTWLYKLTIDKQYFNIGAVVGILTFIILAIGSLLTYRNSKSYKEEGGF